MPTFERPTNIGKYEILATLGRGGMESIASSRSKPFWSAKRSAKTTASPIG